MVENHWTTSRYFYYYRVLSSPLSILTWHVRHDVCGSWWKSKFFCVHWRDIRVKCHYLDLNGPLRVLKKLMLSPLVFHLTTTKTNDWIIKYMIFSSFLIVLYFGNCFVSASFSTLSIFNASFTNYFKILNFVYLTDVIRTQIFSYRLALQCHLHYDDLANHRRCLSLIWFFLSVGLLLLLLLLPLLLLLLLLLVRKKSRRDWEGKNDYEIAGRWRHTFLLRWRHTWYIGEA